MSDVVVVIPARYGASRLPGKPLLDLHGEPMIARVWRRACQSGATRVVIATDDERIEAAMQPYGADVMLTAPDHPSGTDRLAEVAARLELDADTIVVNVQGDEPLLPPALIDQVVRRLADDTTASIATLAEPIGDVETLFNPNVVKVVRDLHGRALYFSRAPVPWDREHFATRPDCLATDAWLRHIGLYAYRAGFLAAYVDWLPSPLEQLEQLEQLRAMHHGHRIQVALAAEAHPAGVDTEADLARVRRLIAEGEGAA
ncbi:MULTISPECIES: 3-deoxy-manno-octulosonate cytidylyltransferase [Chromohalobacter]|uniref:3-deoxy-manno-octulosonate cytidylyltransferase n=1 Tax=Chromohalobacter TaxID=42054 RepID=UPI000D71CC21|nr:3-deoxy-manno-octulosonate cytidylyltransferase [Chromohalobacter salexigens]MBZ5876743.1 3-deoxy-manno-octulosonate cytidylyltransferase [Chromohalobacter salexigens]MDO0945024.1 3-deoxy-manno-octulosonate cytidylyltransferase [Chromohalobacter salexigens]NWO57791.1 3-deoxy-manno-octulosonate cytidylyltransferase [Chromohalobacter salexigens]PWW38279.1 3-deoxy-manno-octulosonate cytidylyltransferase (CMP-KDO synthetase) [Chromohalobacter salexigens]RXE48054.1 3-deoxy-manno-octulosonate cyt